MQVLAVEEPCWLETVEIHHRYRRRSTGEELAALAGISICVAEKQFVAIVGPSGCGKTTLLKIVNGLVAPTSGEVRLRGRPIGRSSRDRAMVFQEPALFPWYNVIRNVSYGLECDGVPKSEAAARAGPLVKLVGLEGFEQHFPYELSGGMQQRANLARALAVDPAVLIMDEPFAALDAQTREGMQEELLRIWGETKKTVMFITHQIDEAIYLSDRVVVLSARPGRVVADIAIEIERPRSLAVKRTPQFQAYEDRIWSLIRVGKED